MLTLSSTTVVPRLGWRSRLVAARELAARVPLSAIEILMRLGIASVFWKSAMTKLANWDLTLALFAKEYQVPVLPPEIAAYLATAAELTCPVLLVFGLAARFGAATLLGMTLVIQLFVYPDNWSEHLLWASILIYILTRGAGVISIDHAIYRSFISRGDS